MTKDEALQMCLEYIETNAHERKYVRHAIQAALAQPEEQIEMINEIEKLKNRIVFLSSAYEIMSKHNDELMEIQREEVKSKIAQAKERNFCSRCGKRLGLEPSAHTCTPPRMFDDYGNKIV